MGFRLAGVSFDPGAYDFCYEAVGASSFTGPVFQGFGISGGLTYEQVSEYVQVPQLQVTFRIVAAGSSDCSTPLNGIADLPISATTAGSLTTVGLFIDPTGVNGPSLAPFTDEATAKRSNLRGINASPGPNNGTGTGTTFDIVAVSSIGQQDFLPGIPYGGVSPPSTTVDTNGYTEHNAFSGATLEVQDSSSLSTLLTVTPFDTTTGDVYSLFIVGISGDGTHPMQMLICDDTAPVSNHLASCHAAGQ
jgi:hypothetical protein